MHNLLIIRIKGNSLIAAIILGLRTLETRPRCGVATVDAWIDVAEHFSGLRPVPQWSA